jgi:hypothetical protein
MRGVEERCGGNVWRRGVEERRGGEACMIGVTESGHEV